MAAFAMLRKISLQTHNLTGFALMSNYLRFVRPGMLAPVAVMVGGNHEIVTP